MDRVPSPVPELLLAWYDRHRRRLPWRAEPGHPANPYHVWLSEIMLQQTTVAAATPYFLDFIRRWPTVRELAFASLDDVLRAWAGLGYYARARNLHRCARLVTETRDGRFPGSEAGLRELPGIGGYTAAAIAAIAFGRRAVVVDGNVERVIARLFALTDPLPGVKKAIAVHAAALTPDHRAGDHAQAMMDLGATLCTPRSPACGLCPLRGSCAAQAQGIAALLPRRKEKGERPIRHGIAFWLARADGAVLLRRRPETGLLGGMMEFPSTPWRESEWGEAEALTHAPASATWTPAAGQVRHVFTHFELRLGLRLARVGRSAAAAGDWVRVDALGGEALPSVMRKVARLALKS